VTETKKVDFKLTREGLVKIEHKESKGQATCLPESVPAWLDSGWTVVDPATDDEQDVVVTVDEEKQTGTVSSAKAAAPKEK
jgi:hypothetical protein